MWLSSIQLTNFRNYSEAEIALSSGPILFHGENGEGKTNLVEAVNFVAGLESHRVAGYQTLIQHQKPQTQIVVRGNFKNREMLVGIEINADKANRYFVNGNQVRKSGDLIGLISSVIFAPEDLDIVRRDPSDRRLFLDNAVIQLKPRIQAVKRDYERVLKQRNALLKSAKQVANPDLGTLDIWDDQLVSLGVELILQRISLIDHLLPLINDFYKKLSGKAEEIELRLVSAIGDDDNFSELPADSEKLRELFHEKLKTFRNKELERGLTLVGPHRDELLIFKDGLVARSHASQGEAWSLALGLKLAFAELLKRVSTTGDPILLLDDVFAVLDVGRRTRLLDFVLDFEQVIVTAADRSMAPEIAWAKVFHVSDGAVSAED